MFLGDDKVVGKVHVTIATGFFECLASKVYDLLLALDNDSGLAPPPQPKVCRLSLLLFSSSLLLLLVCVFLL